MVNCDEFILPISLADRVLRFWVYYQIRLLVYDSLKPEPLRVGDGDGQLPLQLVLFLVVRQDNLQKMCEVA